MFDNQETVLVDNEFYIGVPSGYQVSDNADKHLYCIESGCPYYFVMNKGQRESEIPDIMFHSEEFVGIFQKIEDYEMFEDCSDSFSEIEGMPTNIIVNTEKLSVRYETPIIAEEFASFKFCVIVPFSAYMGVFRSNSGGHTVEEMEAVAKTLLGTIDSFFFDDEFLVEYWGDAEDVIIPKGTRGIDSAAFYSCDLKSVVIPEGVTTIDGYAFQDCVNLSCITFQSSIAELDEEAFIGCTNLERVYFCDWKSFLNTDVVYCSDERIWGNADVYINGEMLTDRIVIPDGMTRIGEGVFRNCAITSVVIPNSVTSIGSGAFVGCTGLTSITIPDSVISIGDYAFEGCEDLENVYFDDMNSFLSIDFVDDEPGWGDVNYYFNGELVKEIVIPDGMTSIGCFYGCKSIESITIPSSVTTMADNSFFNCKNLKSIYFSDLESFLKINRLRGTFEPCLDHADYYIDGKLLTEITIPEGVTKVRKNAVSECKSLESITIPNSVTNIENAAFYACSSLVSIIIPASVTRIESAAFARCKSLESVCFSDVTSMCKMDYDGSPGWKDVDYYVNGGLVTDLIIPEGITSIGDYAFSGCKSLKRVTISGNVTSIGEDAFNGCNSLERITIPEGVTKIGGEAFRGCKSLESITIPSSVTSIGEDAFGGCSSLERITDPEILKTIPKDAFNRCEALESVYFSDLTSVCKMDYNGSPGWKDVNYYINGELVTDLIISDDIISIGDHAFSGCKSLERITISDSVTSIGEDAFGGCSNLTSITIPAGVTKINGAVFSKCEALKSVYFSDLTSVCKMDYDWGPSWIDPGWKDVDYYIDGELLTDLIIPDGIVNISDYAFSGCNSLVSITIPDSITSIGENAFSGCNNLISITIPSNVAKISGGAFARCEALKSVYFSDLTNVLKMEYGYFGPGWNDVDFYINGKLVTDLIIPDGIVNISNYAFSGCNSLENITISGSVTSIGKDAFSGCSNLASITIPANVTTITNGAFARCNSLESVHFNNLNSMFKLDYVYSPGWKDVDYYINEELVIDLIIPDGIVNIDDYTFSGCKSLANVTIPDSVTRIGWDAFSGCCSLTSIIIPDSVTEIGESAHAAFEGCNGLIIHAHSGSFAEKYAKDNNIPFKALD